MKEIQLANFPDYFSLHEVNGNNNSSCKDDQMVQAMLWASVNPSLSDLQSFLIHFCSVCSEHPSSQPGETEMHLENSENQNNIAWGPDNCSHRLRSRWCSRPSQSAGEHCILPDRISSTRLPEFVQYSKAGSTRRI